MNRTEISEKSDQVIDSLIEEKGYVSFVDVFVRFGYLTDKDIEDWRMKRVPFLERKIGANLSKAGFIIDTVSKRCEAIGLKPRFTAYSSWGKGTKQALRFSKSGSQQIEKKYSTHYVKIGSKA